MELKKSLTEYQKEDMVSTLDNEGFWYALTDGGYIIPEKVLENKSDVEDVNDAIETLRRFESCLSEFE